MPASGRPCTAKEKASKFSPALSRPSAPWANGGSSCSARAREKTGPGIFPAYAQFTTDLHSLGQYIQSGERILFETFVTVEKPRARHIRIPEDRTLDDGLDTLAGSEIKPLNDAASAATKKAHIDGGVPVIELTASGIFALLLSARLFSFLSFPVPCPRLLSRASTRSISPEWRHIRKISSTFWGFIDKSRQQFPVSAIIIAF